MLQVVGDTLQRKLVPYSSLNPNPGDKNEIELVIIITTVFHLLTELFMASDQNLLVSCNY